MLPALLMSSLLDPPVASVPSRLVEIPTLEQLHPRLIVGATVGGVVAALVLLLVRRLRAQADGRTLPADDLDDRVGALVVLAAVVGIFVGVPDTEPAILVGGLIGPALLSGAVVVRRPLAHLAGAALVLAAGTAGAVTSGQVLGSVGCAAVAGVPVGGSGRRARLVEFGIRSALAVWAGRVVTRRSPAVAAILTTVIVVAVVASALGASAWSRRHADDE